MTQFYEAAIDRACEESSLVKALGYIALWECERVIPEAHKFPNGGKARDLAGQGWDTCFTFLIQKTMEAYTIKRLKGT